MNQPLKWTKDGFIEHLAGFDKRMKDRALAFIIGSGASRPSGIKTGGELVDLWLKEIHRREDFNKVPLEAWTTAANLGIAGFEFGIAAEFYPQIFQRRFAHDREEGFAFLEEIMEKKEPSLGYSILAEILSHTRHKVVVTTNFDNLVGDALAIHAREHPLVCGHESLAGFIRPNMRRPLVAKIHRDLFLAPKNDAVGVGCLEDGWEIALTRLFDYYTPIVIGYGGNDGSLMGFLDKAELRGGLWWCYRAADGEPAEKIQKLVKSKKGHLIPIIGFDEFMLELGARIVPDFDIAMIGSRIEDLGKERARRYRDEAEKLKQRIDSAESKGVKELEPARRVFLSTTDHPRDWWGWELKARAETDPQKMEENYRTGVSHCPDSPELIGNFALFMENVRKDYDEAERLYRKAIEIDPNHANNIGNFAVFMENVRKDYDEAERLYRKAIEIDPNHAHNIGNFAVFMENVRKDYDEAERLYRKAIEIDPNHADNIANFTGLLSILGRDEEALEYIERLLQLTKEDLSQCTAEALFYRVLLAIRRGTEPKSDMEQLKGLLTAGYTRGKWSFDRHLEAVDAYLGEGSKRFYRALADAILDEGKAVDLEGFPEWQALSK